MDRILECVDCISALNAIPSISIYEKDKVGEKIPKFTIAIPTYKRTSTLSETIESALSQVDFDDYNIIVVDNNPERGDETEIFMAKYSNHPKVTYYKNIENVGMGGNWNKCFLLSHSENTILVHDDDVISPYALKSFYSVLKSLPQDWAIFKPLNSRFSTISELNFKKYSKATLIRITKFHFFAGSAIDAPSVILCNKEKMIKIGGVKNEYYPCIDYVLTFQATYKCKTYVSYDIILGGYRVANNTSLSKEVMDNFFIRRTEISNLIMNEFHIPKYIRRLIHTINFSEVYPFVKDFYDMHDYEFTLPKNERLVLSPQKTKILNFLYKKLFSIINWFNKRRIGIE